MISVGFARVSKNVRVGFVVNPLIVAYQGTKVLPSVCALVRDLAGYRATVKHTRPSRDSLHNNSTKNQETHEPINTAGSS